MRQRRRSHQRVSIGIRIGSIVHDGRETMGMTKHELAERAGISRQMVALVEGGRANPSLDVVVQLLDGLGLELDVAARSPIAIGGPRTTDATHAICSGHVQRRLEAAGWKTAREVRIDDGRYVGWIDLLAFHEPTGVLLVIEIKTRIEDLGSIERSMDWYVRASRSAARRLGWHPRRVGAWLLALATDEVEGRIRENGATFGAAFPLRASELAALLDDPNGVGAGRGLALVDPGSRRRSWLIRTRADGRRSAAPYRGYADFMARRRRISPARRHSQ